MLRNIRPRGYVGLAMTFGLPWALLAAVLAPSVSASAGYLLAYLILRLTMAWIVAAWGLGDPVVRKKLWLVPLRDAANFAVWVAAFFSSKVRWRGVDYRRKQNNLMPVTETSIPGLGAPAAARLLSARRSDAQC